jgi:large subunit ribosomal protein L13
MQKTYNTKASDIQRDWWMIDAAGQPVGRIAVVIARVLQGKHKPVYAPHIDLGDHVIILNAGQAILTGKKSDEPVYWHTMYPGGLRSTTRGALMDNNPEKMLMRVIKGMLPKTKLRARMMRRVRIYNGTDHPHTAQQPKMLNL